MYMYATIPPQHIYTLSGHLHVGKGCCMCVVLSFMDVYWDHSNKGCLALSTNWSAAECIATILLSITSFFSYMCVRVLLFYNPILSIEKMPHFSFLRLFESRFEQRPATCRRSSYFRRAHISHIAWHISQQPTKFWLIDSRRSEEGGMSENRHFGCTQADFDSKLYTCMCVCVYVYT